MVVALACILGLIFGSFASAFAYRVPRGESLGGRSACPNCGAMITAAENIPVFSYLFLRGKCRHCGVRISVRYPLIEIATAALFGLAVAEFGLTAQAGVYAAFFWVLVVLTVIDLESQLLPDIIVVPATAIGWVALGVLAGIDDAVGDLSGGSVLLSLAVVATVTALALIPAALGLRRKSEPDVEVDDDVVPIFDARGLLALVVWVVLLVFAFVDGDNSGLSGAIVGSAIFSGFFMSIAFISPAGIGGGDVKLAVILGAFVGYIGAPGVVIAAMFLSFLSGAVIGAIPTLLSGGTRRSRLPFGPFLCLGTVTAILIGERLVDAYSELLS